MFYVLSIYYLWRDHCVTWNLTKQTWLKNIFYRSVVISHTATYDLTILLNLSVHFSPRSYSESPIPRANSAPRIWASSVPIRAAEFRSIINLVTSVNLITLRKGINYIQLYLVIKNKLWKSSSLSLLAVAKSRAPTLQIRHISSLLWLFQYHNIL